MKYGVILVNTGSPDSFNRADVKSYLSEFLMDERVIDIATWKRRLLVKGIIAPFRSKNTSKLYSNIWTKNGSPLIQISKELASKLADNTGKNIYFAMRYGNPGIAKVLEQMNNDGIENVILVPMFAHYAMSTYESVVDKVKSEFKKFDFQNLKVIEPYYENPDFIHALVENSSEYLQKGFDALIISYHSLPIRHITKMDKDGKTCLQSENCCEGISPVHKYCYRAQTLKTTKLFIEKAGLNIDTTYHTYQSAMKAATWLGPSTEDKTMQLAGSGIKKLIVICPGFSTDNLETLEEIGIRLKKIFLDSGGQEFVYIPALNTNKAWVSVLSKWIGNEME